MTFLRTATEADCPPLQLGHTRLSYVGENDGKESLLSLTMATRRAWALQWQEASVLNAMDLTAYGQGASDTLLAADLELQVYQLLLSNVAQGDWVLDSLQLDTLKGIANQCPNIGGPGVLHARAVLSNPAQAQVTLQWAADARQLQIYGATGQFMAQYPLEGAARNFELSLEGYPKGLYFLALKLSDGSSSTIKLIKQ